MNLLITMLIALSLSMDAFSLALSLGVLSIPKKKCFFLAFIVGIFHFIMPLLGHLLGISFINKFNINTSFLSSIIFFYIAIQMIKELKTEGSSEFDMRIGGMLIFALGVSLDSFGIGFTMVSDLMYLKFLIFSIFSFSFTLLGLFLGKFINKIIGYYSSVFGIVIMIILSLVNFVNFCAFN